MRYSNNNGNNLGFDWKTLIPKQVTNAVTSATTTAQQAVSQATKATTQASKAISDVADVKSYVNDLKKEYIYIRDQYVPKLISKTKTELLNELQNQVVPKVLNYAKQEVPKLISNATQYVDKTIKPKVDVVIEDTKKAVKVGIIIVGGFCALTLIIQLGILIALLKQRRRR